MWQEKTMKILPLFMILFFFSGAIIFTYLAWTTLRDRDEPETFFAPIKKPRGSYFVGGGGINAGGNDNEGKLGSGQLTGDARENDEDGLGLLSANDDAIIGNDLQKKIEILKMKVVSKLRRHILDGSKLKGHINHYGVNYTKLKSKSKVNRAEVLCRIKRLHLKVLDQSSSPVFAGKKFPSESLFSSEVDERSKYESGYTGDAQSSSSDWKSENIPLYRSCAVIPNSAALDGAKHGIDIDSHDFILRFNNAPTQGFEDDVGALTSMRIINSQVATKPIFGFPQASYFTNNRGNEGKKKMTTFSKQSTNFPNNNRYNSAHYYTSTLTTTSPANAPSTDLVKNLDSLWESTRKYLIWDPCNYGSTIEKWYKSPDFPLFEKYFNLTATTKLRDRNRFYILDCRVIWKLWEILQEFSFTRIHGTPPTSGFIGIILALQKCERVNVYEYIPSVRESSRCHYYGLKNETNPSCTYGSWHPVSAEKLFFLDMTDSSDKQIFLDGVLSIPGVSKVKC